MTLGEKLRPILQELEDLFIEHSAEERGDPEFNEQDMMAATWIFSSILFSLMFRRTDKILSDEDVNSAGTAIWMLIKQFSGFDTRKYFESKLPLDKIV